MFWIYVNGIVFYTYNCSDSCIVEILLYRQWTITSSLITRWQCCSVECPWKAQYCVKSNISNTKYSCEYLLILCNCACLRPRRTRSCGWGRGRQNLCVAWWSKDWKRKQYYSIPWFEWFLLRDAMRARSLLSSGIRPSVHLSVRLSAAAG